MGRSGRCHQIVRERHLRPVRGERPAHQSDAALPQETHVEAPTTADDLKRRPAARRRDVVDVIHGLVDDTHPVEPPQSILASVGSGQAGVPAHGQRDRSPGSMDFVCQLDTRR